MDSPSEEASSFCRCKKNNGKTWRCKAEALRGHNYCPKHIRSNKVLKTRIPENFGVSSFASLERKTNVEEISDIGRNPRCAKEHVQRWRCNDADAFWQEYGQNHLREQKLELSISAAKRCKKHNGKGWRCTNVAYEGSGYCKRHRGRKTVRPPASSSSSNTIAAGNRNAGKYDRDLSSLASVERDTKLQGIERIGGNLRCEQENGQRWGCEDASPFVQKNAENHSRKRKLGFSISAAERCKKHDGKGWRCKNLNCEGSGYCERHRGRERPRLSGSLSPPLNITSSRKANAAKDDVERLPRDGLLLLLYAAEKIEEMCKACSL